MAKIPWGHTNLIFQKVKDPDQRSFYLQTCAERGWSRNTLEEEIRFDSYSQRAKFQNNFSLALSETDISTYRLELKDEYNLSFLGLEDIHTERQLENALIEQDGGFIVTLFKDHLTIGQLTKLGLNERQLKAVEFAKGKGKITNKRYQILNNCSRNTASNDLADLVEKNILVSSGQSGAGAFYTLK